MFKLILSAVVSIGMGSFAFADDHGTKPADPHAAPGTEAPADPHAGMKKKKGMPGKTAKGKKAAPTEMPPAGEPPPAETK